MHRELGKLAKDVTDDDDRSGDIAGGLDFSAMYGLAHSAPAEIARPFKQAGHTVLADMQYEDLFKKVDGLAADYAEGRAAEMIGKKWVDGELVDNPDARWVITDATRDMVQRLIGDGLDEGLGRARIAQNIIDSDAFGVERAQMIARTEVGNAVMQGQLGSYKSMRDQGVNIEKEWRADEDPCEDCIANEAAGAIPLNDDFPSGDDAPPCHPNCECTLLSVVYDESGDETEEEDE